MKRINKLLAGISAVAAATVLTSSFAMAENTLTWATLFVYRDLDPAASYGTETLMLGNVYETLTFYENGQVRPRLATTWEKSDGGATWTVKLREGVRFHDGSAFDSAAVRRSFEYTRDLGMGAGFLYGGLETVETPDSHTAIFRFNQPIAFDLVASGQYGSYIIAPAAIERGHDWMQEGNAIGTGPYRLTQYQPGEMAVLERFEDYWGGWQPGQIDRVVQRVVTESSTRVQMVQSAETVVADEIPRGQLAALDALPNVSVAAGTSWRNSQFLLNTRKYPTDNRTFREALAHLWDYEAVLNDILHGYGSRPVGPLPVTMWGHGEYDMPTYDPARALELLEESGVPREDWKVTALYTTNPVQTDAMELFQATASQVGVEVELLPQPSGTAFMAKARNLETSANLHAMTWWPAYATPSDWLYSQYRTSERVSFNLSYYANPEFDALVDAATAAEGVDVQESAQAYIAAQDVLMRDTPAIFYVDEDRAYAYSSTLSGMEKSLNPAYETLFVYDLRK